MACLHRSTVVVFCLLLLSATSTADDILNEQQRKDVLKRAKSTKVAFADSEVRESIKMISKPLFRYSDQPRRILDGTFWCWESERRPVAFQKIEYYDDKNPANHWFYCFASASPHRIQTTWDIGEKWTAKKPGIELREVQDAPKPATKPLRIRFQSKEIARRFTIRLKEPSTGAEEQLRFLPRPIHEYGEPKTTLPYGAVYSFASNGTNPDALLMVELHSGDSDHDWKYAWIQMTTGKLTAKLDDQVVWTAKSREWSDAHPCKFDRWLFFLESVAGR